eukprot:s25_g25.t1
MVRTAVSCHGHSASSTSLKRAEARDAQTRSKALESLPFCSAMAWAVPGVTPSSSTYVAHVAPSLPASAVSTTRNVLALDVDEVLCRCAEAFVQWQFGQTPGDLVECFQRCYSSDASAAREQFLSSDFATLAEPVHGSPEALQQLKALGWELHAVTSRPASAKASTERFLAQRFPGLISGLHFTSSAREGPSKGQLCSALGARALVDDQLPNVYDAVAHGVSAVVLDLQGSYAWNHGGTLPDGATRARSWAEVLAFLTSTPATSANAGYTPRGKVLPELPDHSRLAAPQPEAHPRGMPATQCMRAQSPPLEATPGEVRQVTFAPRQPLGIYVADVVKVLRCDPKMGSTPPSGEALLEQKKSGNAPYSMMIRHIAPPDAEIALECVKVVGQDVSVLPMEVRRLELVLTNGEPVNIGRSHQACLSAELRKCISRSLALLGNHFSLSWAGALQFTRLSVNSIFVNQAWKDPPMVSGAIFAPVNGTMFLPPGATLYLCSNTDDAFKAHARKQRAPCANPLEMMSFMEEDTRNPRLPFEGSKVFRVLMIKVAGKAEEPPKAAFAGGKMPTLICTMSNSREMERLPISQRSLPLGPQRTAISRSHLEIAQVADTFLVRNLSVNHVMVGGKQLQRGEQGTLQAKGQIDFLAVPPGTGGKVPQCFLRLELETADASPSKPAPRRFWLELSGSAVTNASDRNVYPGPDNAITIGRAYQLELHQKALPEEVQNFVSREHFRVEAWATASPGGVGGGWYLQVFSVVRSAAHRLVAESGCERLRSGVVGCDGPCLSS